MSGTMHQRAHMGMQARTIPEQIVAGEMLELPRMELERRLQSEFEQNPALALEETGLCPSCDTPLLALPCPACGHAATPDADDVPVVMAEDWESYRTTLYDAEGLEPFASVASRRTLADDLHAQWSVAATPDERALGAYLIDCLDEDGYLSEPLIETATRFLRSVPQVEDVLRRVQDLEPAGVGARDLRECLGIQCTRAEERCPERAMAMRLLQEGWNEFLAQDAAALARALDVTREDIERAAAWLREHCSPYPGRVYRNPWDTLTPREEPEAAPDVVIRQQGAGWVVEIVESFHFRLGVDPEYQRLHQRMGRGNGTDRKAFDHVRHSVANARFVMEGLAQRRRTLHRVMTAVVEAQSDFLRHGRRCLKPLMQKTIAADLGIHESVVCRALAGKLVCLPSGETVPTSQFFDGSAAIKEVMRDFIGREDPARPLSDARIAQLLHDNGYAIARRTVAKYREAMHIPALEARHKSLGLVAAR